MSPHPDDALPLDKRWLDSLAARGYHEPTEVQSKTVPLLLAGKDVIVQSHTGTGKTLAYLLPLVQRLDETRGSTRDKALKAVIVVPTRELASQIERELSWLLRGAGSTLFAQRIIGGGALRRQIEKLRLHPPIVIGTPGRIRELIQLRKLKMHHVKMIVIDEVDQALREEQNRLDIAQIVKSTQRDRQLAAFSATVSEETEQWLRSLMRDPVVLRLVGRTPLPPSIDHYYIRCERRDKIDVLRKLTHAAKPEGAIVFVQDADRIGEIAAKLRHRGLEVEILHADSGNRERALALERFRQGLGRLMIATDVAARGLDIDRVTHVIQFDPASEAEQYVHRSGRTGRMGGKGTVISLVSSPRQLSLLRKWARTLKFPLREITLYRGELTDASQFAGSRRNHRRV